MSGPRLLESLLDLRKTVSLEWDLGIDSDIDEHCSVESEGKYLNKIWEPK